MKNWVMLVAAVCLASGCATSTNHTPAASAAVINSAKIDRPFDAVWDQLVRELSSDFFVINNIDKSSRLINVSFSSNRPSDFIDCGVTSRSTSSLLVNGNANYKTADSASFRTTNSLGTPFDVSRTTKLNGRANIYVAPEGTGTSVIVNAKYVLDINMALRSLDGRPAGQSSGTIDFSTKSPAAGTAAQPGCNTSGVIETKVLNLAGPRT